MTFWLKQSYLHWESDKPLPKPRIYWDEVIALASCVLLAAYFIYIIPGAVKHEMDHQQKIAARHMPVHRSYYDYQKFIAENK